MKLLICACAATTGFVLALLVLYMNGKAGLTQLPAADGLHSSLVLDYSVRTGSPSSRRLLAFESPGALLTPKMELYNYYAQLWAILQPCNASWTVAWSDLFDGAQGVDVLPVLSAEDRNTVDGGMQKTMEDVMRHWNERYEAKNMTWDAAMADELPALKVVGAVWAAANKNNASSLTIVTTCNLARLDQLRAQCLAWPGILSAALHHSVLQDETGALNFTDSSKLDIKGVLLQVANLVSEMQQTPSACSLRIAIAAEVFVERKAMMLFPVNSLRNLARLQTDTPLIGLLDVDLLPSASLYQRMSNPSRAQELLDQMNNTVFVIPGFEVQQKYEHAPWADALVSAGKEVIVTTWREGVVVAFHVERYPPGHSPTNYTHWVMAEEDYIIQYVDGYEPWLIGSRLGMPWHDERYVGFGKNKIQHILHMRMLGYKYKVLYNEYAVHRPHDLASAAITFLTRANKKLGQKNELKTKMFALLDAQEAAGRDFKAVVSPATTYCNDQLAWWHGLAAAPGATTQPPAADSPVLELASMGRKSRPGQLHVSTGKGAEAR